MGRTIIIRGLGCLLAFIAAPGALLAELPKAEQTCINKINKDGVKVQAAQFNVNNGCLKDALKTSLTPGAVADACIEADAKNKVGKKRASTVADVTKKCGSPPTLFFSGATVTNDAGEETAKELLRDVFGPALGSLLSCDTHKNECKCQSKVNNRVSKMERSMAKTWLRCKKAALKGSKEPFSPGGAISNAELEQCIDNPILAGGHSVAGDTKGAIAKTGDQLRKTAEQFCGFGVADEFAGGACAGFSTPPSIDGPGLRDCVQAHARCRLCEMVNLTDALAVDCDAFAGIACP